MTASGQSQELKRRNIRTALFLAGFALFVFITSFPFWTGVFEMLTVQGRE